MSPSFFLPLVLQGALLPFAVALAILLALRKPGSRSFAAPLAVLAATLASYAFIHPQWSLLPRQALDWLPWTAAAAVAGAVVVDRLAGVWARAVLPVALGCTVALMTMAPILASTGPGRLAVISMLVGLSVLLMWTGLARWGGGGGAPSLAIAVVAGAAGLMLMIDASQSLGQLHGALAMACAACFGYGTIRRRSVFGSPGIGVALLVLAALLVNAYVYAGFSLIYVALLVAGLAGGMVPRLLRAFGKSDAGWAALVGTALAAGIPVLVGLSLVLKAAQDSGGY